MTEDQLELLRDKYVLWEAASRTGNMEMRDYNARCAAALKEALCIVAASPAHTELGPGKPQETSERLALLEGELRLVDEALARRPALADAPNRYTAIHRACHMAGRAEKAEAQFSDLKAERGRLVEALEPFAVDLHASYDRVSDGQPFGCYFNVGDLRKARALLTELGKGNSGPSVAESTRKGPVALPETGSAEVGRGEA